VRIVNHYRYGLGRCLTPDHDQRSRHPQYAARRASRLSSVLHEHRGPVLDQGDLGACVGFAVAQVLNTVQYLRGGRALLGEREAYALYSHATTNDHVPGAWPGTDTGSSGLAGAKAARKLGMIARYQHAFGGGQVRQTLGHNPVIIGIPWTEGMFEPTSEGYLEATGDVEGGHEIAVIGLDIDRKNVTILNSWGPGWGNGGRALMTWDTLDGLLDQGGDAIVLGPSR
jgi:C1A family cysteine protease